MCCFARWNSPKIILFFPAATYDHGLLNQETTGYGFTDYGGHGPFYPGSAQGIQYGGRYPTAHEGTFGHAYAQPIGGHGYVQPAVGHNHNVSKTGSIQISSIIIKYSICWENENTILFLKTWKMVLFLSIRTL